MSLYFKTEEVVVLFECWSSGTVSWASVPCKPAKRRTVKQAHMGTGHGLWGSWQSWVGWGDTARNGATCAAARPPAEPRAGRRGIERVRVRQPRAAPHRAGRCCPVRRLPPRFHRGISRAHRCLRDRTPTHMARLLCWCRCARGTCATAPCPRVLVGSRGRVGLDTRRLPSLSEQPGHVRTRGTHFSMCPPAVREAQGPTPLLPRSRDATNRAASPFREFLEIGTDPDQGRRRDRAVPLCPFYWLVSIYYSVLKRKRKPWSHRDLYACFFESLKLITRPKSRSYYWPREGSSNRPCCRHVLFVHQLQGTQQFQSFYMHLCKRTTQMAAEAWKMDASNSGRNVTLIRTGLA